MQTFIQNIVCVSFEDLQFVDKECHKIKSHAEKQGISFDEAKTEKFIIELCKNKQDVQWLKDKGFVPASNQTKRKEQIREVLTNENL
ncbi:hypothetical protein D3C86_1965410 [compost metagenome]